MKRVLYILAVLLTSLLLVGAMCVCILSSDRVETAAVNLVADELSRGLGTAAEVGAVEYHFPARLRIKDIYIEDRQHDTLLYVGEIYAHLRPLPLWKNEIRFSRVAVRNGVVRAYALPSGEYNYQFLVDAFRRTDKPHNPFHAFLSVKDIEIENIRAQYDDYQGWIDRAYMDLYHLTQDSLDAEIRSLSAYAANPHDRLQIEDLRAHLVYNDTLLAIPTLYLRLPHSEVDAGGVEYTMHNAAGEHEPCGIDHSTRTGKLLSESNTIRFHITQAAVSPQDLAFFAPKLRTLNKKVRLTGDIVGTLDSIRATDFTLRYNEQQLFEGDFTAIGLPDIHNPYLKIRCTDLFANARLLQDFVSDLQDRPYRLPREVHRLGDIHYRGQIEGRLHDVVLHGAFRTALGVITTDGALQSDSLFRHLDYNMRVATKRFRIGKMLAHQPLGNISLDVRLQGEATDGQPKGKVQAYVRDLTYNGYTYRQLQANGHYNEQHYDGTLAIKDDNLELYFNGLVSLTEGKPEIDCDLRLVRFRPGVLGLSPSLAAVEVGSTIAVNLNGINVDEMNGYLVVDSLRLKNGSDSLLMQQLKLIVQAEQKKKQIRLSSDYLTMGVSGEFRYAELPQMVLRQAAHYLPHAFSAEKREAIRRSTPTDSRLTFYAYGYKLGALQRVLKLPTRISGQPVVKGFLREDKNQFGLMAYLPGVRIGTTPVRDITLSLDNIGNSANLSVSAEALNMGSLLRATAAGDSLTTHLSLYQTAEADYAYGGEINLCTKFLQYAGKPLIDTHIQPSIFQLRDSIYTLSDSHIVYCVADTTLGINHFNMQAAHQYIRADGMASAHPKDSLRVELGNIDAGYLLPFFLPEKSLKLGGSLTGWATLYSLFSTPMFEADVRLDSALLNDAYVGNATAVVALDKESKNVLIDGDVVLHERKIAHVDGTVETATRKWGIMIYPDSIPLNFIDHWAQGIITDIGGYGSGVVHVFGDREGGEKRTWVETRAKVSGGKLTIPYTGCRYHLEDSVFMDSTSIQFNDITLYDDEGHRLHLDGALRHTLFKNFTYTFDVRVFDALAFDRPDKVGEMLQGKVYANGTANIEGNGDEVRITANARSVGKSRFTLSIDNASSAADNNFVTFVDHNAIPPSPTEDEDIDLQDAEEEKLSTRVLLSMNMDINQHLLFQLMLGERNGDMIQGRGDGAMRFAYDSQDGTMQLLGTYTIQQGSLDFTVGNVIHRRFTIGEGGAISWSGNPAAPQLNVTAKYRVTASLKDLFGSEISQLATSRTSVPVNTCLTLTGNLLQPTLHFGIELPQSDESIQSQIRAIINTDEMLMRQVIYLLVFGRFFTPEYMTSTTYTGLNETYSLLSSTITGQIDTWLSKLTNVFTMGVNIRTDGEGKDMGQEYEAEFQLQPVDRLVINGNVGYRYNDISKQPFFGDLDVEVLLTDDGKLRLKGYTHTVDKYSLRQANTIQGVGFVWKYDFNFPTKEDRERNKILRAEKKAEKTRLKEEKKAKKEQEKATRQEAENNP